jgi:hypothetical protein
VKYPRRRCRHCGREIAFRQLTNHLFRGNLCKAQPRLSPMYYAMRDAVLTLYSTPHPSMSAMIVDIQDPALYD